MELVVTKVKRSIDRLEGLKINGYLLLLAIVGDNCASVEDEAVGGHLVVELQALLRRGDGSQHGLPIDTTLDVGCSTELITEHLRNTCNLITRRHDERNHACSVPARSLKALDQLLDLPYFDVVVGLPVLSHGEIGEKLKIDRKRIQESMNRKLGFRNRLCRETQIADRLWRLAPLYAV
eukprot:c15110_g1_i1 orf=70-606(+)